jgi:hypothetical protein
MSLLNKFCTNIFLYIPHVSYGYMQIATVSLKIEPFHLVCISEVPASKHGFKTRPPTGFPCHISLRMWIIFQVDHEKLTWNSPSVIIHYHSHKSFEAV